MKRLEDVELLDRRVLIRADLDGAGTILARKLKAATPAIDHILSKGGHPIIASHCSPIGGGFPTMRSMAEGLSALLGWNCPAGERPPVLLAGRVGRRGGRRGDPAGEPVHSSG